MKQTRARSRQGFSVESEHDSSYSATLSTQQVSSWPETPSFAHRCLASSSKLPARMESSGQNGRIHVSKEFANLLQKAGKSNWLEERQDKVQAKGKGQLNTYWLHVKSGDRQSVTSTSSAAEVCSLDACGDRKERLVDWCVQTKQRYDAIICRGVSCITTSVLWNQFSR
jgi:hypothetical protein